MHRFLTTQEHLSPLLWPFSRKGDSELKPFSGIEVVRQPQQGSWLSLANREYSVIRISSPNSKCFNAIRLELTCRQGQSLKNGSFWHIMCDSSTCSCFVGIILPDPFSFWYIVCVFRRWPPIPYFE